MAWSFWLAIPAQSLPPRRRSGKPLSFVIPAQAGMTRSGAKAGQSLRGNDSLTILDR